LFFLISLKKSTKFCKSDFFALGFPAEAEIFLKITIVQQFLLKLLALFSVWFGMGLGSEPF